jgi:hypothetical protein
MLQFALASTLLGSLAEPPAALTVHDRPRLVTLGHKIAKEAKASHRRDQHYGRQRVGDFSEQ